MLTLKNHVVQIDGERAEDLFAKLAKKKDATKPYSARHKQYVEFHSAHRISNKDTLTCVISGPQTDDLRFEITRDEKGYLFKMSIGQINKTTLKTMNKALRGVAQKLKKKKKLSGFSTKRLDGIYLWGSNPDELALKVYEEAVELGQMSSYFRDVCVEWNISVEKYPKTY